MGRRRERRRLAVCRASGSLGREAEGLTRTQRAGTGSGGDETATLTWRTHGRTVLADLEALLDEHERGIGERNMPEQGERRTGVGQPLGAGRWLATLHYTRTCRTLGIEDSKK